MYKRQSLSREKDRADKIYRFLIKGFQEGSKAVKMLKDPDVYAVFYMNRQAANEDVYKRQVDSCSGISRTK